MARRVRRGVKVRRVVRRFELWSVAKMALIFHLFCYALTVAVLVVLWNVAFKLGSITKLETFLSDFGFSDKATKQDFRLNGDALFRAGTMAGLGLVALNTLVTVLLAFFYNGVSGLFGGVVVSVLEERPPMSPAERRAVVADGRGERLALPAGQVDPVTGKALRRRARRKGVRGAEAAAKAERAAREMAASTATLNPGNRKRKSTAAKRSTTAAGARTVASAPEQLAVVPTPAASAVDAHVPSAPHVSVAAADDVAGSVPRRPVKAKSRNGQVRKRVQKAAAPLGDVEPIGRVAEHWANGQDVESMTIDEIEEIDDRADGAAREIAAGAHNGAAPTDPASDQVVAGLPESVS